MAAKVVVFVAALAACGAVPVIIDDEYVPGVVMRIGRSPNVAFGFGSGFSSNIGGISHSTGMGTAFQSGDAQAYGAGLGSNGNYASGVGMASAGPSYPVYQQQPYPLRNNYGSAVSSAQNYNGLNSAVSSAQTANGLQYGSATSAAQNNPRYQSAVASAQNVRGLGYDAQNDFGSAVSAAQTHNGGHFGSAVSAAQNNGAYRASTAQAVQQRGASLQHSGASSINAPGLQAAQSHAVNNGFY